MPHSLKRLYRIVAIDSKSNRTVMMTGLNFLQAIAGREAMANSEFEWFRVEREPKTDSAKIV